MELSRGMRLKEEEVCEDMRQEERGLQRNRVPPVVNVEMELFADDEEPKIEMEYDDDEFYAEVPKTPKPLNQKYRNDLVK